MNEEDEFYDSMTRLAGWFPGLMHGAEVMKDARSKIEAAKGADQRVKAAQAAVAQANDEAQKIIADAKAQAKELRARAQKSADDLAAGADERHKRMVADAVKDGEKANDKLKGEAHELQESIKVLREQIAHMKEQHKDAVRDFGDVSGRLTAARAELDKIRSKLNAA
jgi:chromosome segregation ATPase